MIFFFHSLSSPCLTKKKNNVFARRARYIRAMDGSEKFRVQGSCVVREGIALGLTMSAFALYVAAWAYFIRREVQEGNEVRDAGGAMVTAPFEEGGNGLLAFLSTEDIFGDLARDEGWRERVTGFFTLIDEEGILTAIDTLMVNAMSAEFDGSLASAPAR